MEVSMLEHELQSEVLTAGTLLSALVVGLPRCGANLTNLTNGQIVLSLALSKRDSKWEG